MKVEMEEREIYSYRSKFTEKKSETDEVAPEYDSIDEYLDSLTKTKESRLEAEKRADPVQVHEVPGHRKASDKRTG